MNKLQIKPGMRLVVLHAPPGHEAPATQPPADAVLLFAQTQAELEERLPQAVQALREGGMLWIAYPKKSSGLPSDLTRDEGWVQVRKDWDPVRQVALDDTWTALRFTRRSGEDPVEALFAKHPELRPLYQQVHEVLTSLGPDVRVEPRKSYVGYARKRQFAVVAPKGKGLQLGLRLESPGLEPSAGFGSGSITSKTRFQELDERILGWLREAYQNA